MTVTRHLAAKFSVDFVVGAEIERERGRERPIREETPAVQNADGELSTRRRTDGEREDRLSEELPRRPRKRLPSKHRLLSSVQSRSTPERDAARFQTDPWPAAAEERGMSVDAVALRAR